MTTGCADIYNECPGINDTRTIEDFERADLTGISDEGVYYGEVTTAEQAAQIAEEVWSDHYSKKEITGQRPQQVIYLEGANVWLVEGTMCSDCCGGTLHAYISAEDGKILALWGEE